MDKKTHSTVKFSIIIRTYNEARYLPELLESIARQAIEPHEIETILVDSGSTDATLEIAQAAGCRIVHIAKSDFSFGRSLNYGCNVARGDTFIFVSGHCIPCQPDWLAQLTAPLFLGTAAISYGRQVGGPATKFSEHQLFAKYFPDYHEAHANPIFCNNANAALHRHVWEANRFDESLTGLEDMDLGRRIVEKGMRIAYVPEAPVYHYHHEAWSQVRRRYEREALALRTILPSIQVRATDALRYFFGGVLGDFSKALEQKKFHNKAIEILIFRFCQFHGTWKGQCDHRNRSHKMKEHYFYPHSRQKKVNHTPNNTTSVPEKTYA
jgi:rhamnosyltransferase